MFPELLIDDDVKDEEHNLQPSSIVEQFAVPSQRLKSAILDLLSLRDQLNDALNDVPNLIRSLLDSDPVSSFISLCLMNTIIGCCI